MALDDDLFVHLIDLGVNDFVLDCLNGPDLNLFRINVQQLGQLLVLEVRRLRVQSANLHIRLLSDEILLRQTLTIHQLLVLADLASELLCRTLTQQVEELDQLWVLLLEVPNRRQVYELGKVDHINGLDGQDDASSSL